MNYLRQIILSLTLGIGSCNNLSPFPEKLEAMVNSGSDIDLPTNCFEGLPADIIDDTFPDTTQTSDYFTNHYSPITRSQEYFFTTEENHYFGGSPLIGLDRLRLIKDFADKEGLASQLVDTEGNFFSFCDNKDNLLENVCELNLLQSGEAQLAFYKKNDSGTSPVTFILGYKKNFGDGLVPIYFNPDTILSSPSGL